MHRRFFLLQGRLQRAALLFSLSAALSMRGAVQGAVTVSNVIPRTDSTGEYMDAHDGNTIQ